jgi:hypothetical protein
MFNKLKILKKMKIKNLIAVAALLMGSTNAFAYDLPATFNNGGLQYEATITDAAARTADVTLKGVADNEKGKALIAAKAIETVSNFTVDLDGDVWTCKVVGVNMDWATKGENATEIETLSVNGTNFTNKYQLENSTYGLTKLKNLTVVDKEEPMETSLAALLNATTATLETLDISACAGITAIPDAAFKNGALTSISLPEGVTTIGAEAFYGTAITTIELPAKVNSIGAGAFSASKLTAIDLSGTEVTAILDGTFNAAADLATVTLNAATTVIGTYAFYGTAITAIDVPETVNALGTGVFAKCEQLASVTGLAGITTIPDETFNGCTALATVPDLTKITLIGKNAFNGTAITTVTLGNTNIKDYAFANCSALTEVTVKDGDFWGSAFEGCTKLTTVTYSAPTIGTHWIDNAAFMGCVNYPIIINAPVEYLDWHLGWTTANATTGNVAPTNCEFKVIVPEAKKITTKDGFAKWFSATDNILIDPADAKVFSVYADNAGDGTIYFQSLKLDGGKYAVNAGDHVVIQSSAEEVEYTIGGGGFSVLIDDIINFDGATTLAQFQKGDKNGYNRDAGKGAFVSGQKLYRLTNKNGIGFSVFTGTKMAEGQFFIQSIYTPDVEGRAKIVWLDEDGNVIDGAATAIKGVKAAAEAGAIYNLSGQKVNASYKGVVIKDGKKYIQK